MIWPRTINKKKLCHALGLIGKNGNIQYTKLRAFYLTDAVLEKCEVDPIKYSSIRVFNIVQTELLMTEMDLQPNDFENKEE